jgi:hypothetical protein
VKSWQAKYQAASFGKPAGGLATIVPIYSIYGTNFNGESL